MKDQNQKYNLFKDETGREYILLSLEYENVEKLRTTRDLRHQQNFPKGISIIAPILNELPRTQITNIKETRFYINEQNKITQELKNYKNVDEYKKDLNDRYLGYKGQNITDKDIDRFIKEFKENKKFKASEAEIRKPEISSIKIINNKNSENNKEYDIEKGAIKKIATNERNESEKLKAKIEKQKEPDKHRKVGIQHTATTTKRIEQNNQKAAEKIKKEGVDIKDVKIQPKKSGQSQNFSGRNPLATNAVILKKNNSTTEIKSSTSHKKQAMSDIVDLNKLVRYDQDKKQFDNIGVNKGQKNNAIINKKPHKKADEIDLNKRVKSDDALKPQSPSTKIQNHLVTQQKSGEKTRE